MGSKYSPSELSSGLVMGADFFNKFGNELVKAGGGTTFIHFLTTKQGKDALKAAAEAAVKHRLPVPRTLLEKLEAEYMIANYDGDPEDYASDMMYCWDDIDLQKTFGIEVLTFCNDPHLTGTGSRVLEMPDIIRQIAGKPLPYPLIVQYKDQPMVVVDICVDDGVPSKGEILEEKNFVGRFKLAAAKYFDLEH